MIHLGAAVTARLGRAACWSGLVLLFVVSSSPSGAAPAAEETAAVETRADDTQADRDTSEDERAPAQPTSIYLRVDRAVRLANEAEGPLGFVSGRAVAGSDAGDRMDVIIALDASAVTTEPAGSDIDGDGKVWRGTSWLSRFWPIRLFGLPDGVHGDSVLASEIAAVDAVLDALDSRVTRVGVVAYAGGEAGSADHAWTQIAPTTRYDRVRSNLREMLTYYYPDGSSDLPAGLRAAALELSHARGPKAERRHIVLVSQGYPQSQGEPPLRTEQRAINMAKRLGRGRVRVHTYAVGPLALESPRAATQVAEQSGGRFVAVDRAGDLPSVLPTVDLAQIAELRVTHLATQRRALQLLQRPDGGFAALVPLVEGPNEIEVFARASNGAEQRVRVTLELDPRKLDPEDDLSVDRLRRKLRDSRREITIEPTPAND